MAQGRTNRGQRESFEAAHDARSARTRVRRTQALPLTAECAGPDVMVARHAAAAIDPPQATVILNSRGGLTIPQAMRRALALDSGGRLIALLTPEGILFRPAIVFPLDECEVRQVRASIAMGIGFGALLRRPRRRVPA